MPDQQMLKEVEDAGRGGDTLVGHLTPGEIVIPVEIANDPEMQLDLQEMFLEAKMDINEFTVGHEANKINPETGYPEFLSLKSVVSAVTKPVTSVVKSVVGGVGSVLGLTPKIQDNSAQILKAQEDAKKAAMQARGAQIDKSIISAEMRDSQRRRRSKAANILAGEQEDSMPLATRRLSSR